MVVVFVEPFSAELNLLFASELGFALLAGAAAVTAGASLRRARGRAARWAYSSLAAGLAAWMVAELVELLPNSSPSISPLDLATDLLYLLSYSLILLAGETVVARPSDPGRSFHVQIELLATILVIDALLAYFLVLPFNLDPEHALRSGTWWTYYVLFDLLLLARLALLLRRSEPGTRRRFLGLLTLAGVFLLAADLFEVATRTAGYVPTVNPIPLFLYYSAFVAAACAGRTDLREPPISIETTFVRAGRAPELPQFSPVLAYVVLLPLLHLIHESLLPSPESYRASRNILVVASSGILAALAAWAWARFRARHLRLQAISEHASEALARSRQLEAIGRLAAGVAHDFNNRLTVILGFASRLEARVEIEPATVQAAAAAIRGAAEQASRLTAELLATGQKQLMRPERIDVAALAEELAEEARRLAGPEIEIRALVEAAPLWIEADAMHLRRFVWNLVDNARDAMPRGGSIEIVLARRRQAATRDAAGEQVLDGDYVSLSVRDSGLGMTDETRERLFEPFFTTKPFGQGTGLGLAALLGLVRQNRGFVFVESALGRGSRFELLFPSC